VKSVDVVEAKLQVRFLATSPIDPSRLIALVARRRGSMTPSGVLTLAAPDRPADRINAVKDVLAEASATAP
jgi:hypothetical protein